MRIVLLCAALLKLAACGTLPEPSTNQPDPYQPLGTAVVGAMFFH